MMLLVPIASITHSVSSKKCKEELNRSSLHWHCKHTQQQHCSTLALIKIINAYLHTKSSCCTLCLSSRNFWWPGWVGQLITSNMTLSISYTEKKTECVSAHFYVCIITITIIHASEESKTPHVYEYVVWVYQLIFNIILVILLEYRNDFKVHTYFLATLHKVNEVKTQVSSVKMPQSIRNECGFLQ